MSAAFTTKEEIFSSHLREFQTFYLGLELERMNLEMEMTDEQLDALTCAMVRVHLILIENPPS